MSYRVTNLVFILLLIVGILFYLVPSLQILLSSEDIVVNQRFYPSLLGIIALVLSIVVFIKTIINKDDDSKFSVDNIGLIFLTLLLTIVYVFLWSIFRDLFYVFTGSFLFALITIYTHSKGLLNKKTMIRNVIVSILFTVIVYYLFGQLFSIRF